MATDSDFSPSRPEDLLYSIAATRELDRLAIEEVGIPGYELMTRAARYALDEAQARWPGCGSCAVVCGGGNNGGDGYVFARLAAEAGWRVNVYAVMAPDRLSGDAAKAYADLSRTGIEAEPWADQLNAAAELVVDALFGSGLSRPPEGDAAAAIDAINAHSAPVLALDIPSGIDGDSGKSLGAAVSAALTTTFVGRKPGLHLESGRAASGAVRYDRLQIPDGPYAQVAPRFATIAAKDLARLLPARDTNAHKGRFGHVLIVGGSSGMGGAARLAAEAALKSGAGLVSVATHPDHAAAVMASRPELMVQGVRSGNELAPMLERASVIAIGPGLGTSEWGRGLFEAALAAGKHSVLDADALNLLAESPQRLADCVLTPHPGEAARLLGKATSDVQANREAALEALLERYGGPVVLKGAGTLIGAEGGIPWLCVHGNPGMAAPGMGDVLTGVVAALLAQGLSPTAAAVAGVDIHARAGDLAAGESPRGLTASDVLAEIRAQVNP